MAFKQIRELKNEKVDFKEYVKFEAQTQYDLKVNNMRFNQIEKTMKESIDYMIRYQWKETRNIVNKAISKVTRPLQLKDLFFVNVGGTDHEIYR